MILLGILLFIYIYNVPIIPINTTHILSIISIIYIINYLKNNFKEILKYIESIKVYILPISIIISIVYVFFMYGINKFIFAYIIVLENIPIIFALYLYAKKQNIKIENILNLIIIIGIVQGTLAILAYFIKPIQKLFINLLILNNAENASIANMMSAVRLFGYSSNLTFSTPIVQTIIAFISLQMFINKKEKKYLLAVPLLVFSAIINARISIIITVIGSISILISNINKANYKKICLYTIIIFIIASILITILLRVETNNKSINWILTSLEEILALFKGEKIGYFDALFNEFIGPPTGKDLILGLGENKLGIESDVGYINDLYMGGIILCVLLYPGYIYMTLSIKLEKKNMSKLLRILGLLTFIAMNIKWCATQPNNVLNLYMLIYIVSNLEEKTNSIKIKDIIVKIKRAYIDMKGKMVSKQ